MKAINTRSMSVLTGVLLPALFACSSTQIQTATDPQANLSKYKTYAWAPNPPLTTDGPQHSILDQTIKSATEQELADKGLVPAKDSRPDLLISYFGVSRDSVTYGAAPYSGYGGYYPGDYYREPYVTREGSLTLQFKDPKTDRVVWQGTAAETIGEAGASQEQVQKAVSQLIEKYPVA